MVPYRMHIALFPGPSELSVTGSAVLQVTKAGQVGAWKQGYLSCKLEWFEIRGVCLCVKLFLSSASIPRESLRCVLHESCTPVRLFQEIC